MENLVNELKGMSQELRLAKHKLAFGMAFLSLICVSILLFLYLKDSQVSLTGAATTDMVSSVAHYSYFSLVLLIGVVIVFFLVKYGSKTEVKNDLEQIREDFTNMEEDIKNLIP